MNVYKKAWHRFGAHRVIAPPGAMPQSAWKVDNTPAASDNEILCDVETLNIDSASFRQISEHCERDADRIAHHVMKTVRERGKQHNPVTGSGGMFIGRVLKVGTALRECIDLKAGDRILAYGKGKDVPKAVAGRDGLVNLCDAAPPGSGIPQSNDVSTIEPAPAS